MANIFTIPKARALDNSVLVMPGALLYFYETGTSNPKNTYADRFLNTPHTNPVIADAYGTFEPIWLDNSAGNYRAKLADEDNVTIWIVDEVGIQDPVVETQQSLGEKLFNRTDVEIAKDVFPIQYQYQAGVADRYETLDDAVLVCKGQNYKFLLSGISYSIESSLVIDEPITMTGVGCNTLVTAGSIIDNTTNDVVALSINSAVSNAVQRCVFRDFGIVHEAPTKFAMQFNLEGAYGQIENVVIACHSLGYGGVLFGDEIDVTVGRSWQGTVNNLRVDDATDYGIRVNTTGHTLEFRNCSPRSAVNGAHGIYINSRNVHIYGGQYGANNTGGIPIYFHCIDTQAHARGSVNDCVFENVDAGEYAVVIDGTMDGFNKIELNRLGIQLLNSQGTLVKFGRTSDSILNLPTVLSPTGGGKLVEWGEFSQDCIAILTLDAATAPVTVHASATRAVKVVVGRVPRTSVANITTAVNLTTILQDGIVEMPPGFIPVHNGVAWNYLSIQLADDTATNITPPSVRGIARVMSDRGVTKFGMFAYDTDAGGAAVSLLTAGADFNVTTGVLGDGGGTDAKVTCSAHTDGKIYLSNREGGTAKYTVLFDSVTYL